MWKTFRTYNVAVQFYHAAAAVQLPGHLRNQLLRAASSIALNLSEGAARGTRADQRRFFYIAFGSLRECQTILDLSRSAPLEVVECADKLAAHLHKLIRASKGS